MMMLRIAEGDGDDRYQLGVIAWAEGSYVQVIPSLDVYFGRTVLVLIILLCCP